MGYHSHKFKIRVFLISYLVAIVSVTLSSGQDSDPAVFDFIIAGGGTAACVLANRLTADGRFSVLMIEQGGLPHPDLDIPALAGTYFENSQYLSIFSTVPQDDAGLSLDGRVNYLVGKTLGGSSQVNAMFFNRGSPGDYNNWARITGDFSWSYRALQRFFRKLENYEGDFPSYHHGFNGPVTVSRPRYSPGLKEWLEAGYELGYPTEDPNGPQRVSFAPGEFTKRRGRRVSAYRAYIRPIINRPNLKIVLGARVSRVEFEGNRAVEVVYRINNNSTSAASHDTIVRARARREIILSAGAIGSPAILMRSGIGPKIHLEETGISPKKILPVGFNLQDHPTVRQDFIISNTNESVVMIPERDLTPTSRKYFDQFGDGPYSSFAGLTGQAFLSTSMASESWDDGTIGDPDWPDLHIFGSFSSGFSGISEGLSTENYTLAPGEVVISSAVVGSRPKSRGRLTLNITNPEGDPLIDFRYYDDLDDMKVMVAGLKENLRIFENTAVMRGLGARYPPEHLPGCPGFTFRSDEYWVCYARQLTSSIMHATGSCRMGRGHGDPQAVVDSRLRVIGFENLRVVDGSIMPQITNANTQVPVYVIAEKAAEMILRRWSSRYGGGRQFPLRRPYIRF